MTKKNRKREPVANQLYARTYRRQIALGKSFEALQEFIVNRVTTVEILRTQISTLTLTNLQLIREKEGLRKQLREAQEALSQRRAA